MDVAASRLMIDLRSHADRVRQTTCTVAIQVDDVIVWPVHGDGDARIEIQIDDLLAHLTDFWKPLMLRQVYPIQVNPRRPSGLRREAEHRWEGLPAVAVDAEEDAVSRFEEAHDLSRAFAGIFGLPPFWIFRSGDRFILETAEALWCVPFAQVRSELTAKGDWICRRLAHADPVRWDAAIRAWRKRDLGDAVGLLAWSAGLDRGLASALIHEGTLEAPQDFEDAANDVDELRIAARIAGALPPDQIRGIIGLARQFSRGDDGRLRELADICLAHVTEGPYKESVPFRQGEAAACFLRERLSVSAHGPVPVFEIAAQLGIDVRHASAEPPTLDGLAIWGSRFGPGVFLNASSRRILARGQANVTASPGARVTLAHELCHLLLDGDHALSAVEVLKARMPTGVEQRAKSFAGEFLLPTQVASRHWISAGRPIIRIQLRRLIRELASEYMVTHSVAAWKVEHAAREYDVDLGAVLDAVVPRR